MGITALMIARLMAVCLLAAALQTATSDSDISCKYLLGAMATALIGTNSFWAIWMRSVLKEKDAVVDARILDLQAAFAKVSKKRDQAASDS